VTGFLFPVDHFTPGHAFGILSLLVLPVAIFRTLCASPRRGLAFDLLISAVIALYLNVFCPDPRRCFGRYPPWKRWRPIKSEPPFLVTQVVVMALFVAFAIAAAIPVPYRNGSRGVSGRRST